MSEEMLSQALEHVKAENAALSVGGVVEWAKKAVREYGCPHQDEIIAVADRAIDAAVAINVPQIPDVIEQLIDQTLASWGKQKVRSLLAKACAVK